MQYTEIVSLVLSALASVVLVTLTVVLRRWWTRLEKEYLTDGDDWDETKDKKKEQQRNLVPWLVRPLALFIATPLAMRLALILAPYAASHLKSSAAAVVVLTPVIVACLPIWKLWDARLNAGKLFRLSLFGAVISFLAVIILSTDGLLGAAINRWLEK